MDWVLFNCHSDLLLLLQIRRLDEFGRLARSMIYLLLLLQKRRRRKCFGSRPLLGGWFILDGTVFWQGLVRGSSLNIGIFKFGS